jgi:hypothetical protein
LKIAACLGSTIHTAIVDEPFLLIVDAIRQIGRKLGWVDIFDSLADEGLFNRRKRVPVLALRRMTVSWKLPTGWCHNVMIEHFFIYK